MTMGISRRKSESETDSGEFCGDGTFWYPE